MIFLKEEQTIVSFWWFFQETKEKLENSFQVGIQSIPAIRCQTHLIIVSEKSRDKTSSSITW